MQHPPAQVSGLLVLLQVVLLVQVVLLLSWIWTFAPLPSLMVFAVLIFLFSAPGGAGAM